jgi:hypothetical protein
MPFLRFAAVKIEHLSPVNKIYNIFDSGDYNAISGRRACEPATDGILKAYGTKSA